MPRQSRDRIAIGDTTIYPHSRSKRYFIRFRSNGVDYDQSLRTSDLKSARTVARKVDDLLNTDREFEVLEILEALSPNSLWRLQDTDNITLSEYVKYFCDHYVGLQNKPKSTWTSDETWRGNKTKFAEWIKYFGADTRLARISSRKINQFLEEKAKETTIATRNRHKSTMSTFFKYAQEKRFIEHDPIEKIKSHTEPENAPNPLTRDELTRLVKELPHYSVLIITLLRSLGLRMGELQRAKWDDVNWEDKSIIIRKQKNDSWRNQPITATAHATLKEMYEIQKTDNRHFGDTFILNLKRINKGLTAAAKRAGLDHVKPHMMRHTFATEVWESCGKLPVLMSLLGHTSPSMSLRYAKYRDQDNRDALSGIEALDAKEATVNHPTQMKLSVK